MRWARGDGHAGTWTRWRRRSASQGSQFILAAWEEGTGSGIAPELMAYAALYTALTDLVASYGEASVVSLVSGLVPRVEKGEFTLYRTRQ